jgi:hypothetical protein
MHRRLRALVLLVSVLLSFSAPAGDWLVVCHGTQEQPAPLRLVGAVFVASEVPPSARADRALARPWTDQLAPTTPEPGSDRRPIPVWTQGPPVPGRWSDAWCQARARADEFWNDWVIGFDAERQRQLFQGVLGNGATVALLALALGASIVLFSASLLNRSMGRDRASLGERPVRPSQLR